MGEGGGCKKIQCKEEEKKKKNGVKVGGKQIYEGAQIKPTLPTPVLQKEPYKVRAGTAIDISKS